MENRDLYPSFASESSPASKWLSTALPLLVVLPLLLPGCAEKMSLEKARQVAVTMTDRESFTPPPRRIDDILVMLEAGGTPTKVRGSIEGRADSSPPQNADAAAMMEFFMNRGLAAWEMGKQDQALEDLRSAYETAQRADIRNEMLMVLLAKIERDFGNFRRALALVEKLRTFSSNLPVFDELVKMYGAIGDVAGAKKAYEEAAAKLFEGRRPQHPPEALFLLASMRAAVAELEGNWNEAELHIRKALGYLAKIPKATAVPKINHRLWLSKSLVAQERFLEGELEVRQALKEGLAHLGNTSIFTLRAVDMLVDVTLAQGRVSDAERLARVQIRLLDAAAVPPDSILVSRARMSLANVLSSKCEFTKAVEEFDLARKGKEEFEVRKVSPKSLNMILTLLMTGRTKEADPILRRAMEVYRDRFGEGHLLTAEVIALQGLGEALTGSKKEAFRTFGKSLPILIAGVTGEGRDFSRAQRLRTILEAYLGLLSEIQREQEMELGIDAVAEGFKIADALRSRSVQGALAASSARAASTDPELSELIRKEQDAQNQISAIQEMLVDMLAAKEEEQIPQLISDMRSRMDALMKARTVILEEIKARFPKYADFISPEPPSLQEAAHLLHTGEALLSAYTTEEKTYIWLLTKEDPVRFAVSKLGRKDLQRLVTHLRKALDPKPQTLGDIPAFDIAQGYELYERLLKPVEAGWKQAEDLIVVTGGALGQIPIAVLPTSLFPPVEEKGDLFSSYRRVPWLIRKTPVSTVPSVSSFVNLRTLPKGTAGRKPLAGFGDPLFNRMQASLAQNEKRDQQLASRGRIGVRGIRMAEDAELDSPSKGSTQLGSLSRLPDTSEELKGICEALGGDLAVDIFTGRNASELRVKTMNLSDRRVIAFATHALVPGDLDGLDQPALALSAPSVTGDKEDGLLTMAEVLKLKLNADWVVLSACNTGAAEGEGAEAVSGLGRAFFYAGTRALLVSMWPVETTSARLLTTGLFRSQRESGTMSNSAALRKSILDLIDHQVLIDPETRKTVATYAHPMFWAPFVVVGETSGSYRVTNGD